MYQDFPLFTRNYFLMALFKKRKVNFTTFFQIYGEQFINELFKILDPLSNKFDVIIFDEEIDNKNV